MDFILFSAGKGTRLNMGIPKCLVEIKGKSLLEYQINAIQEFDKSSIITTSKSLFNNSTSVCEPIKPRPPVTNILLIQYLLKQI